MLWQFLSCSSLIHSTGPPRKPSLPVIPRFGTATSTRNTICSSRATTHATTSSRMLPTSLPGCSRTLLLLPKPLQALRTRLALEVGLGLGLVLPRPRPWLPTELPRTHPCLAVAQCPPLLPISFPLLRLAALARSSPQHPLPWRMLLLLVIISSLQHQHPRLPLCLRPRLPRRQRSILS